MVNFKSAITLGLMVSTASAALKHDKRHVHHRRAKAPCTTSKIADVPYPIGNSTLPAGTGAVSTSTTAATSSESVITYTVVPVPVNPTSSVPSGNTGASPSTSAAAGAPSPSGGSGSPAPSAGNSGAACGAATSYVTVQQTVTVTAGQAPETSPEVVVPSTTAAPVASSPTSSPAAHTEAPPPPPAGFNQIGGSGGDAAPSPSPSPVAEQPQTTTAAAPATSSSPAKTSPPASSGGSTTCSGGNKLGIAWSYADFSSLGNVNGACWAYDWNYDGSADNGVQYVPSLQKPGFASGFASKVQGGSYTFLKHVNEPDMDNDHGGCNQTPSQIAQLHREVMAPLASTHQIGMPAVSAYDATVSKFTGTVSGLTWLESFVQEVGCDFAFADAHWYGDAGVPLDLQVKYFTEYIDTFKTRLDAMCSGKQLPIWFTEIAPGSASDMDAFMAAVAPVLNADSRVARFSAWSGSNSATSGILSTVLSALA